MVASRSAANRTNLFVFRKYSLTISRCEWTSARPKRAERVGVRVPFGMRRNKLCPSVRFVHGKMEVARGALAVSEC